MTRAAASAADRFPHLRILASAGSGKTYQLTNRYLSLIEAGVEPSSILASTFTRAAAGEIRDRVLLRLAEAAADADKRRELASEMKVGDLPAAHVFAMLRTLTAHQHELQIRTLDSFFAGIVRAFALELGVPPDCEVIDEVAAADLRARAIGLMLDESQPQRLIDLLRRLSGHQPGRSVTEAIDKTVHNLHQIWRQTDAAAWECIAPPEHAILSPSELVQAIDRFHQLQLDAPDRAITAHQRACERARSHDWEAFLSDGMAAKIAAGESKYDRRPISQPTIDAYEPLIQHAKAAIVNRLREGQLAAFELLGQFDAHYQQLLRQKPAMTFSDVTQVVGEAIKPDSLLQIHYRLDARLHHLLLDEMQDTSISQWRALAPIAGELVSHMPPERTFFCVGDAKQSIYGWREACPEVLQEIPELLRGFDGSTAVQTNDLTVSYRSSQVVLDAVNEVFSSLTTNAALTDWPSVAERWRNMFQPHQAADRVKGKPGRVELIVADSAGDGENQMHARLRQGAALVGELHRAAPGIQIGVLTRTNDAVNRLLFELGPGGLKLPASASGKGSLTDAAPVNAILDLLRMADHPEDTISAFNVANSPLGPIVGLSRHDVAADRLRVGREVRQRLLAEGYAATIAAWVGALADSCDARELGRLMQLVSLAQQHDAGSTSLRCDIFVRVVEDSSVSDRGATAIQVMTVHQSKGLEFDAVVLADLDKSMMGRSPAFVVERDGATGPITRVCGYIGKDLRSLVPNLNEMFESHAPRVVHESLSLLYVAMTRAKHGLYMLVDPPRLKKDGEPSKDGLKTLAGVLRSALVADVAKQDQQPYSKGNPRWMNECRADAKTTAPPTIPAIRLRDASASAATSVAASPSRTAAASLSLPVEQLTLPHHAARLRGTIIHRLFQQVEWLEDFDLSDDQLIDLARHAAPRADRAMLQQCVADFRRMLRHKAVRSRLNRGDRPMESLTLFREVPFARMTSEGVQQGAIDRLVAQHGSHPDATVIDFKTDRIEAAQAPDHAEQYRPQMEAYRQAAAELLRLDPAGIETVLLFVEPGVGAVL